MTSRWYKTSGNHGKFQWQIILGAKLGLNFILDLHITIKNNSIYTKIYDKRDDFDFGIVNYPHLDGDVPHATSYGVYVSQLFKFARACSNIKGFNEWNIFITSKLLKQGYHDYKLPKFFTIVTLI
jgi:hypothetical protein